MSTNAGQTPVPLAPLGRQRPLLLLDVDGVLNPLNIHCPDTWPDFKRVNVSGFDLWLSREMGQALNRIDANIVWCSTWCDDPAGLTKIERHLGLSPHWEGSWGRAFQWKSDMAQYALEHFALVVWIDDDEPCESSSNLLRVTPDGGKGLQRHDIARIHATLRNDLAISCPDCGLSKITYSHSDCILDNVRESL